MSNLSYNGNFENPDLLSVTALCGHIQAFKYLFNAYQKKKSGEDKDQYYLAHSAAASGNLKLLKWIIKNTKCDVTDQDPDGLTILHVACLTANLEIVQWILHNTHLSAVSRTTEGATPLHFSAWSGSMEIVHLMMETEPRLLNMRMVNGATAAMFATQGGFIELMEYLLSEGANFGLPTLDGVNCLHLAAQQGQLECVQWLVENTGLSLSCKDEHGATPIHYAAINNRHDVVKWLMEKEVRLFKDRFGEDSLTSDIETDTKEAFEALIKQQTNLSATNISGFRALDLVQERLKKVFMDCNTGISSEEEREKVKEGDHCSISVNALLLLQSALSELRSQYQDLLRLTYAPRSNDFCSTICQESQTTVEELQKEGNEDMMLRKDVQSTNTQTEDVETNVTLLPIPPPPPMPPPTHIPPGFSNQTFSFLNRSKDKTKVRRLSTNRKRGSSAGNELRRSLIEELKEKNTLRSRIKKYSDTETTDSESVTSSNDNTSLNESINGSEGTIHNSITDSAPNILTLFQNMNIQKSVSVAPLWKPPLIPKQKISHSKEDKKSTDSQRTPTWMRKVINEGEENQDINISPNIIRNLSESTIRSTKGSKVTELVNMWQNNAAGTL